MTIRVQLVSDDAQYDNVEFLVSRDAVVIGRSVRADIQIVDPLISRLHCEWYLAESGLMLRDLESTNQTILNGEPIDRVFPRSGDCLLLGNLSYVVEFVGEDDEPSTVEEVAFQDRSDGAEMPTTRMKSRTVSVANPESFVGE